MKVLIFDLDDTLFDSSGQQKINGELDIKVFDNTYDVLSLKNFKHILVTRGNPELQNKKIDLLKIRDFFADIYICDTDEGKYECLKKIYQTHTPPDSYVIGNRIDCEIRYGNMHDAPTIHYLHGKYSGLVPQDLYEIPKHTVCSMLDLKELLQKLETYI